MGVPQNGWFLLGKNPINIDDDWGSPCMETTVWGYIQYEHVGMKLYRILYHTI